MNTDEVVVHVEQGHGMRVIFHFLTKGVRESGKPANVHSHGEILSLDVAGGDMLRVRVARHRQLQAIQADSRAVARLSVTSRAINLHEHRVVNVPAEGILYSRQVHLVAVRRQLNAVRHALGDILQEVRRAARVTKADQPAQDQLALRFNRNERPDIAREPTSRHLRRDMLLFRAHEGPDFINLDTLRSHVADRGVLVFGAGAADRFEQAEDGALCHSRQSRRGAHRATLDQRRDDRDLLSCAESIHDGPIILYRFSMSSGKRRVHPEILGRRLLCLRPAGASGLPRDLAAATVGHGDQPAFTAYPAAFPAHFRHHLRDDRPTSGLPVLYRGQDDAAGVLHGIQPWLANAFRHVPRSHGHGHFVKREGISN